MPRLLRRPWLIAIAAVCLLGAAAVATAALIGDGDAPSARSRQISTMTGSPLPKPRPRAVEPEAGAIAGATTTLKRSAPPPPRKLTPQEERALGLHVPSGRLYVQGDSLMVGTDPYLKGLLPGWSVSESVKTGRSLPEGLALLRKVADRLPPVVIVGLGTNDDADYPASFEAGVQQIMGLAGPRRCVIWVDVYRPGPGDHYNRFNQILEALQSSYSNLLVASWSRLAARHPEWFSGDLVHPGPDGYQARARMLVEKMGECVSV